MENRLVSGVKYPTFTGQSAPVLGTIGKAWLLSANVPFTFHHDGTLSQPSLDAFTRWAGDS